MTTVLVVGPFDAAAMRMLSAQARVINVPEIALTSVRPHLADSDVLITRRLTIDRGVYEAAPRLRLIVKLGTGIDEIDLGEATRREIAVRNTAGANAPSVAELTLGLIVGVVRGVGGHHARMRETRRWDRELGLELFGKTLGVIGLGHVGSRVARLASAMEMRVIGCDPYIDPAAAAAPLRSYADVLAASDVVSLHVPFTGETRGMVDAQALRRMPRGGYLINTSRGEIVDEDAVLAALDAGYLAGYAADVLAAEEPGMEVSSPLLDHPKVILTPHLGAWTEESHRRVCRAASTIVLRWMAGDGDARASWVPPSVTS
jgi:phosphoglycerate dehydrogenase-like enzyme